MQILLVAQAVATIFMTGIIWFVQVVHYPLMASVGVEGYALYQRAHQRLTTFVVAPPMIVELLAAVALVVWRPVNVPQWAACLGLVLVGLIWTSTAVLQIPAHRRLAEEFDVAVHRRLVRGNWVRTVLWSGRTALASWMLARGSGLT